MTYRQVTVLTSTGEDVYTDAGLLFGQDGSLTVLPTAGAPTSYPAGGWMSVRLDS